MKKTCGKLQVVAGKIKEIKNKEQDLQFVCQQLTDILNGMTLTELIVEALFPVNVYPIKTDGDKIVLLQPKLMPDCAIAMFDFCQTSTQWQVRFNLSPAIEGRRYSVMCACCANYRYGLKSPVEDTKSAELKLWENELKEVLKNNLYNVCREHGINKVYMRKAQRIYENYAIDKERSEIFFVEADKINESQKYNYAREKIEKAWDFIDWKRTTFRL